jgi:hypothetical protein
MKIKIIFDTTEGFHCKSKTVPFRLGELGKNDRFPLQIDQLPNK